MSSPSKRLAGFYGIIAFKLAKGLLLLSLAVGVYLPGQRKLERGV